MHLRSFDFKKNDGICEWRFGFLGFRGFCLLVRSKEKVYSNLFILWIVFSPIGSICLFILREITFFFSDYYYRLYWFFLFLLFLVCLFVFSGDVSSDFFILFYSIKTSVFPFSSFSNIQRGNRKKVKVFWWKKLSGDLFLF